jgi:mono/diheme cytochrome c family protein
MKGPVELGAQHALGRYIARVTCAECHGPELKGNEGDTPDLTVAGGYTREEFERLVTEGVPSGGRKLKPLMELVAKERFARMTRHERDALHAYLKARAEQPQ